jgi:predicted histidine transporter YuiF (NhaC family)
VRADYLPADAQLVDVMDRMGLNSTQAMVFSALWTARGRTVTYSMLGDLSMAIRRRVLTDQGIRTAASRINRRAKHTGWPFVIHNTSALGYRLTLKLKGWTWRDIDPLYQGDDE